MAALLELPVRALTVYPGAPTAERRRSRFGVTPGEALQHLRQELQRAGALRAVLELDVAERDVRQDGQLRADARPRSPAVVVSYEHPQHGMLRFPCDTFTTWTDNVRAIGLSLEALRAVERYGVVKRQEQFLGFKALPATTTPAMTTDRAAELLAEHGWPGVLGHNPGFDHAAARARYASEILSNRETYDQARKNARARVHPDVAAARGIISGEDPRRAWDQVEAACVVLDAFWGMRR